MFFLQCFFFNVIQYNSKKVLLYSDWFQSTFEVHYHYGLRGPICTFSLRTLYPFHYKDSLFWWRNTGYFEQTLELLRVWLWYGLLTRYAFRYGSIQFHFLCICHILKANFNESLYPFHINPTIFFIYFLVLIMKTQGCSIDITEHTALLISQYCNTQSSLLNVCSSHIASLKWCIM